MRMHSRDFGAMRIVAPPRRSAILARRLGGVAGRAFTSPLTAALFLILMTWLVAGAGVGVLAYLGRRGLSALRAR